MPASSATAARLAFFGRPGSFSQAAALKRFPKADLLSCSTIEESFERLIAGDFDQIVVPVENASSGIITNTTDQLMRLATSGNSERLRIREAIPMRIELALMALPATAEIQRIYSHRAPFDHARDWLRKHYPNAEQISVESTPEAAALAAREKGSAAIANARIAQQQGLEIITRRVGSHVANQTTFLIVGLPLARTVAPTHTSLVFELPHSPGSLVAVLQVLARRRLNLTKILSRPIPGRFEEYRFMIEFLGAPPDKLVLAALARLKTITAFYAEIGSYPVRKL